MSHIHPKSVVEPGAKIGKNVTVEAFAVVKSTVTLQDNVIIKSHAYIDGYTTIGEGTIVWPGASIGTKTQDRKYRGEKTFVVIGKNSEIREFVTINSSCREGSSVIVGDDCLVMAYCHIAHNCRIGNHVIMSNSAMLAGHVVLEDYVVVGGMTPIHQFCRIGSYSMVGGFSRVSHDIPPYTVGGGFPYKFGGLNNVGLKRHGFPLDVRKHLFKAFKFTYRSGLRLNDALKRIEEEVPIIPEIKHWVDFCRSSKRGLLGLQGVTQKIPEEEIEEEFSEYEDTESLSL